MEEWQKKVKNFTVPVPGEPRGPLGTMASRFAPEHNVRARHADGEVTKL